MMNSTTRTSLVFLATLLIFSIACGLLDDEATNIVYQEAVPFSFTIDADQLCVSDAEIDCDAAAQPSPERVELPPVEFAVEVDIVEATGNNDLQSLAGKFRAVEIRSIDYAIQDNSLSFDLPEITLYVGPLGSEDKDSSGVVELATIPATAAGETQSGRASVHPANSSKASELFKSLQFTTIPYAAAVIEEGQLFPPTGQARIRITIHLRLTANPIDAL